jgi:hypothetical protein
LLMGYRRYLRQYDAVEKRGIIRGLRVLCIRGVTPRHLLSLPSLTYFGIARLDAQWYGTLCHTLSVC